MRRNLSIFGGILLAVITWGCVHRSPTAVEAVDMSTLAGIIKVELERIAVCLSQTVSILNREPAESETLGSFICSLPADRQEQIMAGIRLDQNGEVVLSDSSPVMWKREFESCFLFVRGSVSSMQYTIYAKGHNETATVSIQATFGDPFGEESKEGQPNQALQTTRLARPNLR